MSLPTLQTCGPSPHQTCCSWLTSYTLLIKVSVIVKRLELLLQSLFLPAYHLCITSYFCISKFIMFFFFLCMLRFVASCSEVNLFLFQLLPAQYIIYSLQRQLARILNYAHLALKATCLWLVFRVIWITWLSWYCVLISVLARSSLQFPSGFLIFPSILSPSPSLPLLKLVLCIKKHKAHLRIWCLSL